MVARVERRFDLKPERLAGDTAYGAAKLLKWLWDRAITPHVPVWDKSARPDGKFGRADFVFDSERNVYICPAGAELTHSGVVNQGRILPYRASTKDCSICKLKPRCTTAVARKVSRDIDEDVREHVRALADTEAFQRSCRERKEGRGEVRAHEAHPQTRPPSATRFERRERRSAADCHGAEPQASRQARLSKPTANRVCGVSVKWRRALVPGC